MRALIVGLGGIGQRHARNLRFLLGDRVELLAHRVRGLTHVVDSNLKADKTKSVERELGIEAIPDLAVALARSPDVAFICNPSRFHIETAAACLEAGCDLFIEKPLSDSLDKVDELIERVERSQRVAMVGYQLRFHPGLRDLAAVIESGVLGALLAVRATVGEYLPGFHPYEDYRQSYASRAELGGGVVLTQIHEFDYLCSLFGPVTSVYSIGGHFSHLDLDVEDVASTLLEATVDKRKLPIYVQQDYLQCPPTRQCEVVGDRGRALLDFRDLSVTVTPHSGDAEVHSVVGFDRNLMFIDEVSHFLECVTTRSRPIVDLREGVKSLRVAVAAKQSMLSGAVVHLTEDKSTPSWRHACQ